MNLITLDDKSQFDKLPNFDIGVGNFPKNVSTYRNNLNIPIIAYGNPTVTGVRLADAFLDQGAQAMVDINLDIEIFRSLKGTVINLPIVRISSISAFETKLSGEGA